MSTATQTPVGCQSALLLRGRRASPNSPLSCLLMNEEARRSWPMARPPSWVTATETSWTKSWPHPMRPSVQLVSAKMRKPTLRIFPWQKQGNISHLLSILSLEEKFTCRLSRSNSKVLFMYEKENKGKNLTQQNHLTTERGLPKRRSFACHFCLQIRPLATLSAWFRCTM